MELGAVVTLAPPGADASSAAGCGEPVSSEAAGPLSRAMRQAATAGSGDASHPRAALTSVGLAVDPHGGQARHTDPLASSGLATLSGGGSRGQTRPPIPRDLQRLIVRMAQANPTWGEERTARNAPETGADGVTAHRRTVSPDPGARRGGQRSQRWATFCGIMCTRSSPVTSSRQ